MQAKHESIAVIEETTADADDAGQSGEPTFEEGQPDRHYAALSSAGAIPGGRRLSETAEAMPTA